MSCKECCKYSGCIERDRDYHCREFIRDNSKNDIHKSNRSRRYENKHKTRSI